MNEDLIVEATWSPKGYKNPTSAEAKEMLNELQMEKEMKINKIIMITNCK